MSPEESNEPGKPEPAPPPGPYRPDVSQAAMYYQWAPPPWTSEPRGRHSSGVVAVFTVAAFIAGLVFGGGVVGAVWVLRTAASGGPTAEERLPDELPRLIEFVEAERGLAFRSEVDVEILADDEFERALYEPVQDAPDEPGDYAATYEALGLIEDADTYYDTEAALYTQQLAGFYSYYSERLVVRETEWNPDLEVTIVHELTHALQDQHFDLTADWEATAGDGDAYLALTALVEGDAVRVGQAYVDQQSNSWQREYYSTVPDDDLTGPYDPLADLLGWLPYWTGETAVAELLGLNGNITINNAMEKLPATSEQVLNVNDWMFELANADPPDEAAAADVPADATIVDEGTLGVAMLGVLVVDFEEEFIPEEFLTGWRGDAYVTWQRDDETCTAVTVLLDDDDAVAEAEAYLERWVSRTDGDLGPLDDAGGPGIELIACALNPAV